MPSDVCGSERYRKDGFWKADNTWYWLVPGEKGKAEWGYQEETEGRIGAVSVGEKLREELGETLIDRREA